MGGNVGDLFGIDTIFLDLDSINRIKLQVKANMIRELSLHIIKIMIVTIKRNLFLHKNSHST